MILVSNFMHFLLYPINFFARISAFRVGCRGLHKQSALNKYATLYSVSCNEYEGEGLQLEETV
jgi:hypothetical protein